MTALTPLAARRRFIRPMCGILIAAGFLALWPLQRSIDQLQGAQAQFADVLYLSSGTTLRRYCLGYEGLLADVYWTRVVQYFGRQRLAHSTRFELLGPLLRITTELDPQLLTAYRFGSIFLAEKPPGGAGQPQEALQLLRRGIVANPDYWRLWQDLGFIYYWDLKDYRNTSRIFRIGSERPGALPWMRAMAASVAAQGGEIQTSRILWTEIARQVDNDAIRQSAEAHLLALDAEQQITALNALLDRYRDQQGHAASSFAELVVAGYLPGLPVDPTGVPYVIGAKGRTILGPRSKVDLALLQ
ncbi:MAG: hypothetical protein LAP13_14425 [Acidobacteriia bacterium]|nr:hypothetical protein [Terriglobia bacterium]